MNALQNVYRPCLNCGKVFRWWQCRTKKYCSRACYAEHKSRPIQELFWSHVDRSSGPNACWPWTAARDTHGYGVFHLKSGRCVGAHVFAYGRTAEKVRHTCGNKGCVNPAHLTVNVVSSP